MRPSDLAYKLKTIISDLETEEVRNEIVIAILGSYNANHPLNTYRSSIVTVLTKLNQTVFAYKMKDEYKEIIELFGFEDYINLEITNKLIDYVYTKAEVNDITSDRYAYRDFQRLISFLNTIDHTNKALQKFLIIDKKIELEYDEAKFQFIIPHKVGGQNIQDIISVYSSLNKIYRDLTKINGNESDLRIEFIESGTEILTELKGILEIITMIYILIKAFENRDRDNTHSQITDIKEAIEFREWIDEKVTKGTISPEDARYLIEDISYNVKQLQGIDLNYKKDNLNEVKQLPESTDDIINSNKDG